MFSRVNRGSGSELMEGMLLGWDTESCPSRWVNMVPPRPCSIPRPVLDLYLVPNSHHR